MKDIIVEMQKIHPQAVALFWAFATGALIWGWKKLSPETFRSIPSRFKAIPSTLIAAVGTAGTAALTGSEVAKLIVEAAIGGFSGLTAIGGFEFTERLKHGSKADRVAKTRDPEETDDELEEPEETQNDE